MLMEVFEDFAYVKSGRKRTEAVMQLAFPRTPTELAKLLAVHRNVATRILKDLHSHGLVECHRLEGKKASYRLSKRGDLARQVLDALVQPKTLPDVCRALNAHRNVVSAVLKSLVKEGFVSLFKSLRPARKFYTLTKKGEDVRQKL